MKKTLKKNLAVLSAAGIILTFLSFNVKAQSDTSFKSHGQPVVLVFSDVNYSFNRAGNSKAFDLSRAYLGYEYFFSKTISSRVIYDVADPGAGKLQMVGIIKNALVQYKNKNFSARFGVIGVDQYSLQEKQWGYRYIYKSFQDAYNFGPSADLGIAFEYSPANFISFDLSALNGEGYKKIQSDSTFKTTAGITLRPFKGFILRGYYDIMNHRAAQTTIALFAGYTVKSFKAGLEYNLQNNNGMINGHDFSGISAYASVGLPNKFSVFTRYDLLKSVTPANSEEPWNILKDGQLFIGGLDYSPVAGLKVAPVFLGWLPSDKSKSFTSTFSLNIEIKF
ncbi:MAG: hypothetical protein WCE64_10730 [Bacteroidales bacterium]